MEDIQLLDNSKKEENELKISELTKVYLTVTYKWAKFFAILSFIAAGFILIIGLFMFGGMGGRYDYFLGGLSSMVGLIYVLLAAIYIPPGIFLNKFSDSLKKAIEYTNNDELQIAFQNLKSLFKFSGILAIIVISIYILIFFFAMIIAMAGF